MRTFLSLAAVASMAPLGDQAMAVMSPSCPFLKDRWFSQSFLETTWMSRIGVGTANALPSGCQATADEASSFVSNDPIAPSTFLISSGSSAVIE